VLAFSGCRCAVSGKSLSADELAEIRAKLLFVNEASGTAQVHRFAPDGGTQPLTSGPRSHFPLAVWRGGLVVVASEGEGDLHVEEALWLGPDGGASTLLPQSRRARSVVLTPGADALLMESGAEGFSEIVRVTLEGATALTSNPEGNFEPQALPGGEVLFVSSRDSNPELYLLPADGGPQQRLTQDDAEDLSPRVSPDGKTIAFISTRGGFDEIFLMPASGGPARPLLKAPLPAGPKQPTPREAVQRDLSFSPDGKAIWFTGRSGAGRLRVWRADVATGAPTALTDGKADDDQPKLSPDGKWVSWVSTRDGNAELYVARADGSATTRLTTDSAADWLPLWRP
jgi:TolB protein